LDGDLSTSGVSTTAGSNDDSAVNWWRDQRAVLRQFSADSQDVSDPAGRAAERGRGQRAGSLTSWLPIEQQNPGRQNAPPFKTDRCGSRPTNINGTCHSQHLRSVKHHVSASSDPGTVTVDGRRDSPGFSSRVSSATAQPYALPTK